MHDGGGELTKRKRIAREHTHRCRMLKCDRELSPLRVLAVNRSIG